MKWIITGAAGFIGCHAAARFLDQGHEVVAVDNLSRKGSADNLAWLRTRGLKLFEEADIRDKRAMHQLLKEHDDADAVLHLAGQVAVTTSVQKPWPDFEVNALGTLSVLEAVRRGAEGRPVVLFSSTNKVYGDLEHLHTVERDGRYTIADRPGGISESEPLDFHSPYGCSKGAADQYVRDYARVYGMRTVVIRQSCIYGTRQFGVEDQGWIAWFSIAASTGKPVTIYGDGKQVRDVLWVDDLVDFYQLALDRIDVTQGQVFNVGGGPQNTLSLLELVDWLEKRLGRPLSPQFAEPRPGDQRVFVSCVDKAQTVLGWKPAMPVAEGLEKLLTWVEENRGLLAKLESRLSPGKVLSSRRRG